MSCTIQRQPVQALWDTGAQVSMMSKKWFDEHMMETQLMDIGLLTTPDLRLTAANGSSVPFDGWVAVDVKFTGPDHSEGSMTVPFLVTSDDLPEPIIGYNVIEEVIHSSGDDSTLQKLLASSLPRPKRGNTKAVINLIRSNNPEDFCQVRTGKMARLSLCQQAERPMLTAGYTPDLLVPA